MMYILIILTIVFIGIVFILAKVIVLRLEQRADEDILRSKEAYQNIIDQKSRALSAKTKLEKEAAQIFTLYEMTKEINRYFNEQEAFNVFKRKLKENIVIEDCQLVDETDDGSSVPPDYAIFVLKNKDRKLGSLMYKGLALHDKEKFVILAHQFALAYRRIKLYQEIETLAITDALTGMYTRRYFLERFEEEIKRSRVRKSKIAFLMLDVDHFKLINDGHGHLAGDEVLKGVGDIIRENVREIDSIGRFGGEEFCVVLPDTDAPGAFVVAERIRKAAQMKTIKAYDASIQITISIGISSFPDDGKLVEELIDKADWSLYRAKSQGRNCTVSFGAYKEGKP